MKINTHLTRTAGALALLAGTAAALAQPAIDGLKDASYGNPIWVNTIPTGFGNNGDPVNPCNPADLGGDPAAVSTGVEFSIPVAALGGFGLGSSIGMCIGINGSGHDFYSNQFLPGLPANYGNLGEPHNVNLSTTGQPQHVSFTPVLVSTAPTIDGTKDGQYGAAIALQTAKTAFGNSTSGATDTANGSELDGLYVVRYDNGTPADGSDDVLYVMITGNFESNFNKPEIFFDTIAGGQNVLASNNADVDFNGLNRQSGMTFDAGFVPDFWIGGGCGGSPVTFYPNFAELLTAGGGAGSFQGCYATTNVGGLTGCGNDSTGIRFTLNNSNTAGVGAVCPPPPTGDPDFAAGSEIDAVYAQVDTANNRLYLFVAGNVETSGGSISTNNGNKLTLLFDVAPGGQSKMRGDNVDISFNNLNRLGDDGTGNGLQWDDGFAPDYWMQYKNLGVIGDVGQVVDCATLRTDGRRIVPFLGGQLDYGAYYGGPKNTPQYNPATFNGNSAAAPGGFVDPNPQPDGSATSIYTNFAPRLTGESLVAGQTPPYAPPFADPVGAANKITYTLNNGNVGGVSGTSGTGGELVSKGFELSIDLAELGWDGTSPIKLGGFICNNDATFLSNQVIGGLPDGTGNLGGNVRAIDFRTIAGNQYITLYTPPAACPADFNHDGNIDPDDLGDYITCYFSTPPCDGADFNHDTNIDPDDLGDFITIYFQTVGAGC